MEEEILSTNNEHTTHSWGPATGGMSNGTATGEMSNGTGGGRRGMDLLKGKQRV
jgi:hypothetical protein